MKLYDYRLNAFWASPECKALGIKKALSKARTENDGYAMFPSSPNMPRIFRVSVNDVGGGQAALAQRQRGKGQERTEKFWSEEPYSGIFHIWENEIWDEDSLKFKPARGVLESCDDWKNPENYKTGEPPHLCDEYGRMTKFFNQRTLGFNFLPESDNVKGLPSYGGAYKFGMWWTESERGFNRGTKTKEAR